MPELSSSEVTEAECRQISHNGGDGGKAMLKSRGGNQTVGGTTPTTP
jgi:hypothetical protein